MRKRMDINKKTIVPIAVIIVLLICYYIYYKNTNIYKEFEMSSNLEELLPYEEDKTGKNEEVREQQIEKENKDVISEQEIIIVHVTGEVNSPGVVEVEKGARVIDAVNKAQGFTQDADTEKVNLAYELTDGVKIYIPSKSKDKENNLSTQKYITTDSGDNVDMEEKDMKNTTSSLVNINEATQTELETLPGIGPSIALKIISYRKEKGKFSSKEEIKNVSGIGDSKFESIRELICL